MAVLLHPWSVAGLPQRQHKLLQLCRLVQNLPWDISLQALDHRALLTGPCLSEWAWPESHRTGSVSLSRILIIVRYPFVLPGIRIWIRARLLLWLSWKKQWLSWNNLRPVSHTSAIYGMITLFPPSWWHMIWFLDEGLFIFAFQKYLKKFLKNYFFICYRLIFFVFLDHFDVLISKIIFKI